MDLTTQYGIDENNMIIEGNGRYEALKQLGVKQVPCIELNKMTEEQKKAYILVHNKLNMDTGFDVDILNEELENILNIDMSDFGFELDLENEENIIERTDLSDKIFEKYEIIITCENELDLQKKYEKLENEGYECRISTL